MENPMDARTLDPNPPLAAPELLETTLSKFRDWMVARGFCERMVETYLYELRASPPSRSARPSNGSTRGRR